MGEWLDIEHAHGARYGTVADLRMESGRIYRAVLEYRGHCCAWWPRDRRRKKPIGIYSPTAFRVIALGITPDPFRNTA